MCRKPNKYCRAHGEARGGRGHTGRLWRMCRGHGAGAFIHSLSYGMGVSGAAAKRSSYLLLHCCVYCQGLGCFMYGWCEVLGGFSSWYCLCPCGSPKSYQRCRVVASVPLKSRSPNNMQQSVGVVRRIFTPSRHVPARAPGAGGGVGIVCKKKSMPSLPPAVINRFLTRCGRHVVYTFVSVHFEEAIGSFRFVCVAC